MHKKGAPAIALNLSLQVALDLHFFMQMSMHKRVQINSIKGKIDETYYDALEGASKFSYYGALKTTKKS